MYEISWGGHTWTTTCLDDGTDPAYGRWSVLCLDPVEDEDGTDQTTWPSDRVVGEWAGAPVRFVDAGDHPDHPEGIFGLA